MPIVAVKREEDFTNQATQPPAGGDGMDTENRLTKLEARIDTMLPTLATKGDVSEAKADIIKWLAGVAFAIVTIIIAVLAFMINRALPPQAQQQPVPIIIYPPQAAGTLQQGLPTSRGTPTNNVGSTPTNNVGNVGSASTLPRGQSNLPGSGSK